MHAHNPVAQALQISIALTHHLPACEHAVQMNAYQKLHYGHDMEMIAGRVV